MTEPFSCDQKANRGEDTHYERTRKSEDDVYSIIPEKPMCAVMGVILQQIDNQNQIVTVAVVDKYGEMVDYKDLQHLMPPRKFMSKQGATEEEE